MLLIHHQVVWIPDTRRVMTIERMEVIVVHILVDFVTHTQMMMPKRYQKNQHNVDLSNARNLLLRTSLSKMVA